MSFIYTHRYNLVFYVVFIIIYILPGLLFSQTFPAIHFDEYRAIELGREYISSLLTNQNLNFNGMSPLTGPQMYYAVGIFTKILGESVVTLRFFASFITLINLFILKSILKNYISEKNVTILSLTLMTLPYFAIYSRRAFDYSSIMPMFILLGVYSVLKLKKNYLAGFFFGMAAFTHPVAVPFILFLGLLYFKRTELLNISKILLVPILLLILKLFVSPEILTSQGSGRFYLSFSKFLNIPFVLYDLLHGQKLITSTVGYFDSFIFPIFLLMCCFFIYLCFKKDLKKNLFYFLAFFSSVFILIIIIPALSYSYFLMSTVALVSYISYLLINHKYGLILVIIFILQNTYSLYSNYFVEYAKTGGVGVFYKHETFDSGIKDRKPYHSYYFLNLDKDIELFIKNRVELLISDDKFICELLKYYASKTRSFEVIYINDLKHEDLVKSMRSAFVVYSYRKLNKTININNLVFIQNFEHDATKIKAFYHTTD